MSDNPNDVAIEAWNTVLFDKFVKFRRVLTDGLTEHGEVALREHPFPPGARVLDIGCGFGDATQTIAQMVGPTGAAIGVDCAANFITLANAETRQRGIANASYFVADVQSQELQGPYHHAFARFGTMFFDLPGAALRNIKNSLRPGGDLTMVVWRRREDNPWLHDAEQVVREIVPVVSHEDTDQVHCGPGPFSMAGPDMVSDMMGAAGFVRISFTRHDCDICIGADVDEAIAFALALGPAGEIIRLAGDEGARLTPKVGDALRVLFERRQREDGSIWAGSSSWAVRGRRPG